MSCTSPCSTCDTGPTVCLTCVSNYYFMKSSSKCLIDCGTGYYKNGGECTACVSPCKSCSSESICIDCVSNYYYLNN